MQICDRKLCTACGACINVCPKKCIYYCLDEYQNKKAAVDSSKCINCKLCVRVCPTISKVKGIKAKTCYAAWSNDEYIRKNSASGGIASELYRYEVSHSGFIAGVKLGNDYEAKYFVSNQHDMQFLNSKYVYSDMGTIYIRIKKILDDNLSVTFVGLPCQVAGLKNYLSQTRTDMTKLLLVDLVCHGVTSAEYLKSHIKKLEKKYHHETSEVLFRDPQYYTYTYTFTLKDNGEGYYAKKVHRNDEYQIAYHNGIAYRDNCYNCEYAVEERLGDLTLSDFSGVGSIESCEYDNHNVSCVLINSEKGMNRFLELVSSGSIYAEKRPIEEEYNVEARLHSPTPVPIERLTFLKDIKADYNFDKAIAKAARKIIIKNEIKYYLHIDEIRHLVSKLIPRGIKDKVRRLLYR